MALITVDGVEMPAPSSMTYGLVSISAAESGRDNTGLMHKNEICKKRKLSLAWRGKNWAGTAAIMSAFSPQYVTVRYPDMMSGQWETRTFYTGDKEAAIKLWWTNRQLIEQISFDLVER